MSHWRQGRHTVYQIDGGPPISEAELARSLATVPSAARAEARRRSLIKAALPLAIAGHAMAVLAGFPVLVTSHSPQQDTAGYVLLSAFPMSIVSVMTLVGLAERAQREAIDQYDTAARESGHCPP